MYITSNRVGGRESFSGSGVSSGIVANYHFSVPTFLEGVYSWRTGARYIETPPHSPQQRGQDGWGLITPDTSGSTIAQLAERKRYIEDFARMMVPAETEAGLFSNERGSTTDTGHAFGSLKALRSCYSGTLDLYRANRPSSTNFQGDIWGSAMGPTIFNATPYHYGFPDSSTSPLEVDNANRQATTNRFFAMTAPDRKEASVGSTLIELIRGDVPSLLKNFRTLMEGRKSVANAIGSEALNLTFGWTPLIQEYANVIKTGMAIERTVYYESFRRKRHWVGPSYRKEEQPDVALSFSTTPYDSSSLPEGTIGPALSSSVLYSSQVVTTAVEDYMLTSKYVGLAKAGRRANSFSDRAMEVAQRLGVVDDPEMLWDLTPYSWLVDWFTTMGESIANARTYAPLNGRYTADYAFMTTKHVANKSGGLLRRISEPSQYERGHSLTSARSELSTVSKWRERATPFGFGTQLGSLSASQFGILVALGMAKSR